MAHWCFKRLMVEQLLIPFSICLPYTLYIFFFYGRNLKVYFPGNKKNINQIDLLIDSNFPAQLAELGASLFEIAQSLFTLERTFFLGAMALIKNKSEERQAN